MKSMNKVILLMTMLMFLFMSSVSAHVVVYPKQVTQGSYEKFTARVPTEKEVATVKVEVTIPEEVNISRFEPKADWSYEIERSDDGKITKVSWTATGEGLSATEFGEFNMQGKVDNDADDLVWKAYQTYADGSVVEWIGAEGSDYPASVSNVVASEGSDESNASSSMSAINWITLILSILALVLAVVAVLRAKQRK